MSALIDRFMPAPEAIEQHQTLVAAPATVTYEAACELRLQRSWVVRVLVFVRALVLGAKPTPPPDRGGLIHESLAMGWGLLAEQPGREIIMGAVTQPWRGEVVFRALPPAEFVAFAEPGYVKIVWSIAADPLGPSLSLARTESRVAATDAESGRRFRRYWRMVRPGVVLIRLDVLRLVKRAAERWARTVAAAA